MDVRRAAVLVLGAGGALPRREVGHAILGTHIELGGPGVQAHDLLEARAGALVGLARVPGAKDVAQVARKVHVHAIDVHVDQLGVASKPVGGVDDADVSHELDVLNLARVIRGLVALVHGVTLGAVSRHEPGQVVTRLGHPGVVVGVARRVCVDANDQGL